MQVLSLILALVVWLCAPSGHASQFNPAVTPRLEGRLCHVPFEPKPTRIRLAAKSIENDVDRSRRVGVFERHPNIEALHAGSDVSNAPLFLAVVLQRDSRNVVADGPGWENDISLIYWFQGGLRNLVVITEANGYRPKNCCRSASVHKSVLDKRRLIPWRLQTGPSDFDQYNRSFEVAVGILSNVGLPMCFIGRTAGLSNALVRESRSRPRSKKSKTSDQGSKNAGAVLAPAVVGAVASGLYRQSIQAETIKVVLLLLLGLGLSALGGWMLAGEIGDNKFPSIGLTLGFCGACVVYYALTF